MLDQVIVNAEMWAAKTRSRMAEAVWGVSGERALPPSDVAEVVDHMLSAAGKGLRPRLVVSSGLLGGAPLPRLIDAAAATEMIHLASLVHDDIIDRAPLRRGVASVRSRWDDAVAVLAGDLLYARAFEILADLQTPDLMRYVTQAIATMCEGEIEQRLGRFDGRLTEVRYIEQVRKKTGALLGGACIVGGRLANMSRSELSRLQNFGEALGIAFQIADDLLDWQASEREAGKPVGADLRQGVVTLPVLRLLATDDSAWLLEKLDACRHQGHKLCDDDVVQIGSLLAFRGCLAQAEGAAREWAERAGTYLAGLGESDELAYLRSLAGAAVGRRS